jgi:hypothetical protein
VDVVYTDYTVISQEGAFQREVKAPLVENLAYGNQIGPSFLYRRRVQEGVGPYAEDMFLAEDYDFWLRASMAHHFEPLHRDLYEFRIHGTSLTSRRGAEANYRALRSLKRHLPRLDWLSRRDRADGYLRVAVAEHARGNVGEALRCVGQAAQHAPDRLLSPVSLGVMVEGMLGHRAFLIVQRAYRVAVGLLSRAL